MLIEEFVRANCEAHKTLAYRVHISGVLFFLSEFNVELILILKVKVVR